MDRKKREYDYQYTPEPRNTDLNPNFPHPPVTENKAKRIEEKDEVTRIENLKGSPE